MNQNDINNITPKTNPNYGNQFLKNIFDEDFLDEKDKALSPIELSDEIPEEINKTTKIEKKEKVKHLNINEDKDIKYGSNIVYIGSKIDDNDKDEDSSAIINQQIKNLFIGHNTCKKSVNKRRKKKKI